ncbi:MAG: hypothetical protein ABJG41_17575 [Cyclobacteriaceae bacterium]
MGLRTCYIVLLFVISLQGYGSSQSDSRIYLSFNQPKYAVGDTAYFKAYYLSAKNRKVPGKVILSFDLIDAEGRSVVHFRFNVFDGIGQNQFAIPDSLSSGYFNAVVYTKSMPTGEMITLSENQILIVKKEGVQAESRHELPMQTDHLILMRSDKTIYQTREKVQVEVQLLDQSRQPISGEFSVRVLNTRLFPNQLGEGRLSIEAPISTMENQQINVGTMIKKVGVAHLNDGKTATEGSLVMFYLQKSKWRYQTQIQSNGQILLTLPDIYEPDELFYLSVSPKGKPLHELRITWNERSKPPLPKPQISHITQQSDLYASFAKEVMIINRSYGFFTTPEFAAIQNLKTFRSIEEEIKEADLTFTVDDYISFPTMGELIKEVVRPLYYGDKRRGKVVRMRSLDRPAVDDPVYLIDGVVTKNTDFFLSLIPDDVLEIKIIRDTRKLLRFGLMGRNGIVIVNTKTGDAREPVDPNELVEGLSRPIVFPYSNYADSQSDQVPNFRTCLYWNPSIITDESGKGEIDFYLSDDVGEMIIQVDGINDQGECFSTSLGVNVD